MRRTALILPVLFSVLFSCSKEDKIFRVQDDPSISSVYGTWRLLSRENHETHEVSYKEKDDVQPYCNAGRHCDVVITLAKMNATDTLTGHTITNRVFGSFSFHPTSRSFSTKEFGGTEVGEPRWSYHLWDNMYRIESFAVNKKYLRLFFNDKKESLTFLRQ